MTLASTLLMRDKLAALLISYFLPSFSHLTWRLFVSTIISPQLTLKRNLVGLHLVRLPLAVLHLVVYILQLHLVVLQTPISPLHRHAHHRRPQCLVISSAFAFVRSLRLLHASAVETSPGNSCVVERCGFRVQTASARVDAPNGLRFISERARAFTMAFPGPSCLLLSLAVFPAPLSEALVKHLHQHRDNLNHRGLRGTRTIAG